MWVIEELIDYLKYEGRPTQMIQRRLNTNVFAEALVSKITPSQQIDLARNEYYMEDDWFQIGQINKEGVYYTVKESQFRPKFEKD